MTRKQFLKCGLTAGAAAGGVAAGWFGAGLVEYMGASPDTPWKAFTPEEAAEVERLAEEMIPADEFAPGAKDAKVARFIDWQLAPNHPYERQLPEYRKHLALIRESNGHRAGVTLPGTEGRGTRPACPPMSAAEVEKKFPQFFKMLLRHVNQGYYSHPCQGGNAGFASYRLCGLSTVTGRNIPGKENHL